VIYYNPITRSSSDRPISGMKKYPRLHWYGKVLAGLLTLAVLVVFLGPLLIPTGMLEHEVMRWTHAKTGLTLKIQGPVEVTIFPTLGLSLNRVALMNPRGFPPQPLIQIHHASIRAAFLPLLAGTIRISETTLQDVHLTLRTNRAGVSNVSHLLQAIAGSTPQTHTATPRTTGGFKLETLGRLDLENVDIRYLNLKSGARESVRGLTLEAGPIERRRPFPLSFRMEIRSRAPALDVAVRLKTAVLWARKEVFHLEQPVFHVAFLGRHPISLLAQAASLEVAPDHDSIDLSGLKLSGAGLHGSLSLRGTLAPAPSRDLGGRISFSLTRLKPWLGKSLTHLLRTRATHPPLTFGTSFHFTGSRLRLPALVVTLGAEKIAGQMEAILGPQPEVHAAFVGNTLTLAPLTPANRVAAAARPAPAKVAPDLSGWSWLHALNGEAALRLAQLNYGALTLTKLNVQARLERGTLTLYPAEALGFKGAIALRGSLVASQGLPDIHLHLKAQDLSLHALSTALNIGHSAALSGQLSTEGQASFTGLSMATLARTLSGTGQVKVIHAIWRGVDLTRIVTAVGNALRGRVPSRWPTGGETRIGTLEAQFALHHAKIMIRKAILATMRLRATGTGTIDWVEPHLDLHLLLHPLAGNRPGQIPWPPNMRQVTIPVTIQGSLMAPKVTPDIRSILQSALRSKLKSLAHHFFGHFIPH